jgi:SAM-dependent methyltransferase
MQTMESRRINGAPRYHIRFPAADPHQLDQDEAFFTLTDGAGLERRIRFHDYDQLYELPGLYEQLFYDRLKCQSPEKVVAILRHALHSEPARFNELRVLDLGAGNGIVAEELQQHGVARIVGCDILPAARAAALRDRPGVYDEYYDLDLTHLGASDRDLLGTWNFNCLVTVAALGFGDIPVRAFWEAFNLIEDGGWVAFNIKETFLDNDDTSGFSVFIKNVILSSHLDLYHLERYRHRLSIDGRPLYYFGIAGRKNSRIPESFVQRA